MSVKGVKVRICVTQVLKRIKAKQYSTEWEGHVWQGNESVVQDSHYRPQDLRVVPASLPKSSVSANAFAVGSDDEACLYDDLEGLFQPSVAHSDPVMSVAIVERTEGATQLTEISAPILTSFLA
jgi:hypothetical protein